MLNFTAFYVGNFEENVKFRTELVPHLHYEKNFRLPKIYIKRAVESFKYNLCELLLSNQSLICMIREKRKREKRVTKNIVLLHQENGTIVPCGSPSF